MPSRWNLTRAPDSLLTSPGSPAYDLHTPAYLKKRDALTNKKPTTYPAVEKMGSNGLDLEDVPVYISYSEVAAKWGIQPSSVRNYMQLAVNYGEHRYLPKPDILLVRDDGVALPGWREETIDNYRRPADEFGFGNHTKGMERRGYRAGRHTPAYKVLGVGAAEKLREAWAKGATLEELGERFELRVPDEVQDIIEGRRWALGSGKARGRVPTGKARGRVPIAHLGVAKADEIRAQAAEGVASHTLALQYHVPLSEVEEVLAGDRWVSTAGTGK